MERILVFGMTENPGGVEKVIYNYYQKIDREKLQFDFLCNSHNKIAYEDELLDMGAKTYHVTARSQNRSLYHKELTQVFEEHATEWKTIWVNVSSLANIDYLKYAKKYGIAKRIIHSHNSRNMDSKLRGILHALNKRVVDKYATDFWACSKEAAVWFYKDSLSDKVVIINNAIDVDVMAYDEEKRLAIRESHGWNDKYVIGNIGRLHFQKNQSFMIDIFKLYKETHPDSVLIFIGQGEDEDMLRAKVKDYELEDDVFFAGLQKDIQGWLSSFDLFLFPSVFEGLSVAALEAQANGVPVLTSEKVVSPDTKMCKNFYFLSLEAGEEAWCKEVEKLSSIQREGHDVIKQCFVDKGFEIGTEAVKLMERLL